VTVLRRRKSAPPDPCGPSFAAQQLLALAAILTSSPSSPIALPKRVLVVDDDRHCAELLAAILLLLGHTAVLSDGGSAGIELAKRFQPDVIFWTLEKPLHQAGSSALDAALALRRIEQLRHTRLVALDSWRAGRDRQTPAHSGFDVHLARPVQFDEIEALIRSF
jgi:CheY-like chemotaxis protein